MPEVSEEVMASLNEGKKINMNHLRSLNDFKLLQMAWVYDINFQPTFQMIHERDYLKMIRDTLPASERIDQIFSRLLSHLKRSSEFSIKAVFYFPILSCRKIMMVMAARFGWIIKMAILHCVPYSSVICSKQ